MSPPAENGLNFFGTVEMSFTLDGSEYISITPGFTYYEQVIATNALPKLVSG